jgi:hypothetical protein
VRELGGVVLTVGGAGRRDSGIGWEVKINDGMTPSLTLTMKDNTFLRHGPRFESKYSWARVSLMNSR